jgi:hypothetical protein
VGTILLSALVAHTAWHWMLDRAAVLRQYQFTWPVLDAALMASVLRAVMLLLVVGGAAWAMSEFYRRLTRTPVGLASLSDSERGR